MKEIKTKNHYVPKNYLKNWSDSENKIYIYNYLVSHPNVPEWVKGSIKSNAIQKNLYTFIESGSENDEIERWFDEEFE